MFNKVLEQTIILFSLVIVGFIIRKRNIITDEVIKGFSEFVLKVTLPIFIIVSMDKEFSKDKVIYSAIILSVSILTYIIKAIISKTFTDISKVEDPQKGIYRFLIFFSNHGFMGIAIASALYGDEGVFYAAILNITFNAFVWTFGVKLVDHNESTDESSIKKFIFNPGIISVVIGLIIFLTPLSLPRLVYEPMNMLGTMTIPLAMIIVGGNLGSTELGSMFKNRTLILTCLIRLIVVPFTIILALLLFKLPKIIIGITIIIDAMPSAPNTAIFARRYDSDYSLASQGVFLTTLMSILTIPFIMYISSKLFGL
ncbi:putative auxin efflux carrier [Gottschalkia acidurici 9a]|uniref:Auxin efflux carrier n=1 Tax=Gottschalkia acidurici (strain ATCC 7906 / DSM 604 / BCRC 14475 / CIP 104303 / KCTC 5404 / NCIMB 10678 / 9a) TaxID=1128398 RepID=K0B0K5_GOTA9|nr:AEC family transporter [Gottschalkia acidurici]AFS78176.1 putative auxin efflux carrier [Gottschalkia acidurici 9a]